MHQSKPVHLTRRKFITFLGCAACSPLFLSPNALFAGTHEKRTLDFYHTHTNEKLSATYFDGLNYDNSALAEINDFLKDFRTGEQVSFDSVLLDSLFALKTQAQSRGTFEVISGYRSPQTNEALRKKSGGVAKRSYHMRGKAIDIRLTDIKTSKLRNIAKSLRHGGVGYYAKSDFIHLDTGPIRSW